MIACAYGLTPAPRTSREPIIRPLGRHALVAEIERVKKHGRRQRMSKPVQRVLDFLRAQKYPSFSAEVRVGARIENYLIGSAFQRLIERGYVVRSGESGRYRYRAVK